MPPAAIHVATTCNDAYFPGLCVTVLSAIVSNKSDRSLAFHVFDTGISLNNRRKLAERVKHLDSASHIRFITTDETHFQNLNRDHGGGYSTYIRLLMGSLLDLKRVIYIDCDFLVLSNLASIHDIEMQGEIILATPDVHTGHGGQHRLSFDCPFAPPEKTANYGYWNCGFLLVDLEAWRKHDVEGHSLRLLSGFAGILKAWDQTVLNYVLRDHIGALDPSLCWSSSIGRVPLPGNIHYLSKRKPWNSYSLIASFRLWYVFHSFFVGSLAPVNMPARVKSRGVARAIRDVALARNRLLRSLYLNGMKITGAHNSARLFQAYLNQCNERMKNPLWKCEDIILKLSEDWILRQKQFKAR